MLTSTTASFYSGLSGLQLNIPKYLYPEPFQNVSRLTYYASLFNSIEINSSFYKIPQQATVLKWATSVNDDFRFTFKLYKEITHNKELNYNKELLVRFFESINAVKEKCGCLLIQFPPSAGKEFFSKLNNLLSDIQEIKELDWKIAVEFRNKSWYNEATYNLLSIFNAALVIHDIPKSATPMTNIETDFIYIRFHGPTGNYRDSYSEDFLREYTAYVDEWLEEGKTVFMYFNNTIGDALNNLKTINSFHQNEKEIIK
ncbi:MAG: DUF72 domain-containing protein [Chitinophagaceae bacterium]|nr:DUF72 domain-containing protein [Chitinophagaceae bacterium]